MRTTAGSTAAADATGSAGAADAGAIGVAKARTAASASTSIRSEGNGPILINSVCGVGCCRRGRDRSILDGDAAASSFPSAEQRSVAGGTPILQRAVRVGGVVSIDHSVGFVSRFRGRFGLSRHIWVSGFLVLGRLIVGLRPGFSVSVSAASSSASLRLVGGFLGFLSSAAPAPALLLSAASAAAAAARRRTPGRTRRCRAGRSPPRRRRCRTASGPALVEAEPDLADRRADDQHTGQDVQRDRGRPQPQRQLRGAELGPAGAQQVNTTGRAARPISAPATIRSTVPSVCDVSPDSSHQRGGRRRSTGRRRRARTARARTPRQCGSCPSSRCAPGCDLSSRSAIGSHPGRVRRMRDLNPRGLLTQPAFQASAIGH